MVVYRISKQEYAGDLRGSGARLYGGRWNSPGIALLYTAETRALAALEMAVHVSSAFMSVPFQLISIEVPDNLPVKVMEIESLPVLWQSLPADESTRLIGDSFVRESKYGLLKVPSVIIEEEYNCLLNPLFRGFEKVHVISSRDFYWDSRLSGV